MVNIKVTQFEGPLDLLLQLIEKNELDISTVSLSEITEQYLGTLEHVQRMHPDELADFLVIAAKLLYIKSKILLPQLELPEEEGISLEDQLKLYKTFVDAAENVRKLFRKRHVMYGREHTATIEPSFSPPPSVHLESLHTVFTDILKKIEPLFVIPESVIIRTISIQERIHSIRELVQSHVSLNFGKLLESATSRTEIIVTFLALLELVKQRTAMVVQDENFSEIKIEHVRHQSITNQ